MDRIRAPVGFPSPDPESTVKISHGLDSTGFLCGKRDFAEWGGVGILGTFKAEVASKFHADSITAGCCDLCSALGPDGPRRMAH
jgi:hypothetical protein